MISMLQANPMQCLMVHHKHLLLMKSPVSVYPLCSIFGYCKEIKHACQFVFPPRSIMSRQTGWDISFPPALYLSHIHKHRHARMPVPALLQLLFVFLSVLFFPPLSYDSLSLVWCQGGSIIWTRRANLHCDWNTQHARNLESSSFTYAISSIYPVESCDLMFSSHGDTSPSQRTVVSAAMLLLSLQQ